MRDDWRADPLWRDALAKPEDDAAWAVLADALMSRADPRGELIAVQRAFERARPGPEAVPLRDALRRVLDEHGPALTASLPPGVYRFESGVVRELRCRIGTWLAHHRELRARLPLRKLVLYGDGAFESGDYEGIAELQIDSQVFEAQQFVEWANNPSLGQLRSFEVTASSWFDDRACDAVAFSAALDRMDRLAIDITGQLSHHGVAGLLRCPALADGDIELRDAAALDDRLLLALLASHDLTGRKRWRLGRWQLSAAAVARIVDGEELDELVAMSLPGHLIGDAGVVTLAGCRELTKLEHLDLTGIIFEYGDRERWCGDEGLGALCRSSHLPSLRELKFGHGDRVTEAGLALVAEAPWLPQLRHLELLCKSSPSAVEAMLDSGGLTNIEHLRLADVGNRTAKLLLAAELPQLRRLELLGFGNRLSESTRARLEARFGTIVELHWPYQRWSPSITVRA